MIPLRRPDPRSHAVFSGATYFRLVLSDVDGILTDGRVYYGAGGGTYKAFHVRDGTALVRLAHMGLAVGFVSGHSERECRAWLDRVGLVKSNLNMFNVTDKLQAVETLAGRAGVPLDRVVYLGDDHPDIPALRSVGMGVTVAAAPAEVRQAARVVLRKQGGDGVLAELVHHLAALRDGATIRGRVFWRDEGAEGAER
jgi:3-deoxy-D-manno-octulosonate 8-phosphate phosphatase (KDO 8-P phosphatase)